MLLVALAFATPDFPSAMEGAVPMPCAPTCVVCHTTAAGGAGTITQPFGVAMVDRGLIAYDVASLEAALAAVEADGVDSDGDGTGDVAELAEGADPNGVADFCAVPAPEYGCFGTGSGAAVGVFGLLWGLGTRQRPSSKRSSSSSSVKPKR